MDTKFRMDFISMIAFKYTLFSVIAILLNIFFQYLSFQVYKGDFSIYIAMFNGTLVGLIVKYILDKNFIFYYKTKSKKDDGIKFILYSSMGIFTTLIFWGTELIFDIIFDFESAKYIGALIGLTIGYITKYLLDKNFVFRG